ncbi:MAG: site-specific integrase [Clostridia bacterium]|nr:site-specific integrase [Clostridia bacterium]
MNDKVKVGVSIYIKNGKYNAMLRYTDPQTKKIKAKSKVLNIPVLENDSNKKAAERLAEDVRHKYENEINSSFTQKSRNNPYFGVLLGTAMLNWLAAHQNEYQSNTLNSYLSYIHRMKGYFDSNGITVDNTTPDTILQFYNYLYNKPTRTGKPITSNTVQHYHNILHKFFDNMVDCEYIEKNPMQKIKKPKIIQQTEHIKYYSPGEINELIGLFQGKLIYSCVVTAILTGLRRSELLALTWTDIDLNNRQIHVRHKIAPVQKNGSTSYTEKDSSIMKTSSSYRTIPISEEARKFFLEMKSKQIQNRRKREREGKTYTYTNYVFIKPDGNRIALSSVSDGFRRVIKPSKFDITFHGLRHMTASILLDKNVDLKIIQQILGHSSITTTMNIYAHTNPDNLKSAMNLISGTIKF